MRFAQILRNFLGLHHHAAPLGQRGFLSRLRAELRQFLDRVAQPVAFAPGALDLGAMLGGSGCGFAPRLPERGDVGRIGLQAAKGIEQPAMGGGVHQRAFVVLAVDLDQRLAELLQDLHAHRLIVDKGAGAAVGELHAAQDQCRPRRRCRWP